MYEVLFSLLDIVTCNFNYLLKRYSNIVHMLCLHLQWECKTDMDSQYRFGEIAVNCEGYDYPDDPYVLKGSCGVCTVN